jgi:hypothetical protein
VGDNFAAGGATLRDDIATLCRRRLQAHVDTEPVDALLLLGLGAFGLGGARRSWRLSWLPARWLSRGSDERRW